MPVGDTLRNMPAGLRHFIALIIIVVLLIIIVGNVGRIIGIIIPVAIIYGLWLVLQLAL